MSEDNSATPEQPVAPPPSGQTPLQMAITPQGLMFSFPVSLTIGEETMSQLVKGWLATHPALMQELVQEQLAAKRNELAIIQHVRNSRMND